MSTKVGAARALVSIGLLVATSTGTMADLRTAEQSDGSYILFSWTLQGGEGNGALAGTSVAIDGDLAVIGAPGFWNDRGATYVCDGASQPDPWWDGFDLQEVMNQNPEPSDRFGACVAIHGSMVAVSAPGRQEGVVHLFLRDGGGTWSHVYEVENPGGSSTSLFGLALALSDDYLLIGDPGVDKGSGVVYAYKVMPDNTVQLIAAAWPTIWFEAFGADVDLLGDTFVVGATGPLGTMDSGGRVYMYDIDLNSGGPPITLDTMIAGGADPLSQFGASVALSEHGSARALAVGMPGLDLNPDQHGTVEIYRDVGDGSWLHEASVEAEIPVHTDGFGTAVAMHDNLLAVGAPKSSSIASDNGVGTIYRYSPSSGTWLLETTIHPRSATGNDQFGAAVGLDAGRVVFGAPSMGSLAGTNTGVAILYEDPDGGDWQSDPRLTVPVAIDRSFFSVGAPMPQFGAEIALSGDVALIGSLASRQIHVFRRAGAAGAPWQDMNTQVLPPETNNPPYRFGEVIAMLDDIAVVGAPYAGVGGEVYVYQDISGVGLNWILVQTLTPDAGSSGAFGCAVSLTEVGGQIWLALGDTGNIFDTHNSGEVHLSTWASGQFVSMQTLVNPGYVDGENSQFGGAIDLAPSSSSMLLVAVADVGSGPGWQGRVDLFEEVLGAGFWHQQTLLAPNSYANLFGLSVSFDNDVVAVGSMTSTYTGNVNVFTRSTPLRGGRTGWTDYSFTYQLYSVAGGYFDGFATQVEVTANPRRILVSAPGLDYMETNSGGVYCFAPSGDQVNAWNLDALLMSPSAVAADAAGPMAVGPDTVLIGCPGGDDAVPTPRRVLDFAFGDTVSWTWEGGGNISEDSLWSGSTGGNTGRFSLLLAEPYSINFDLQKWIGSIEAAFNDVTFELLGSSDREITVDLLISSPAADGMATVNITDGSLEVGNDLTIGTPLGGQNFYGTAGSLSVDHGTVTVGNRLDISPSSSLVLELVPSRGRTEEEIGPLMSAGRAEVAGALFVALPNGFSGDNFSEGDQFELLVSQSQPMQGGFDVIVLPGLPGGLAFELSSVPGFRGGDTMVATVVTIAGLLDFGDPNSTTVAGDPTGVEVVDLTSDGADEICVVLAGSPGQLVIFENDGVGGVSQQIIIPTGDEPVDISSGDFDGDGRTDLAVANNLSQDVTVYFNDDNDLLDGFVEADLNMDGPPTCLAGIDADFDLYDDLVVGLEDTDGDGNGYYAIYLGVAPLRSLPGGMVGGGGIAPNGTPLGVDPSEDEDQKDFMFGGRQSDGKTSTVKGSGVLAGVTLSITEHVTGADPGGLTMGDVNGDGRGDICVTSTTNGTIAILLQDAGNPGDFLPAIFVPVGDEPTRITSVDFDNDGNTDLAAIVQEVNPISGTVESVVRVLQGNGSLGFTSLETAWGDNTALVASGDVSGDGIKELITVGGGASFRGLSPLLTLRDTATPTCPGDFDGTGDVGIDDLLILLGEFAECTMGCQSDIDDDGDVDIDDMLALIGAWGTCPR